MLEQVKLLLGITDNSKDDILSLLIEQATEEALIYTHQNSIDNLLTAIVRMVATVYKGNIIKNLIMDCQSYTKYRPNETTGGIFVSWRRKEELPTGA